MAKPDKTGRNDPCPCGSGKKHKNCCLRQAHEGNGPTKRSLDSAAACSRARGNAERLRVRRFGAVRPAIHADHQGYKVVAVGNEVHYSTQWKTFLDFLQYYIKAVLTPEWGKAEIAKPLHKRHPIMKWYDAMCRFQAKQGKGADELYGFAPNGAMRAYVLLAYDLYTLRHSSELQATVVRRLKQNGQFQGARHELFAAATCIRADYEINYEDETDGSRKHTEFIATHKPTKQIVAVEAKSRHRPGVLGYPDSERGGSDVRAGIRRLLKDALGKPFQHPLVVFCDLNLPPSRESFTNAPWFNEVMDTVCRLGDQHGHQDPFSLIVFSSYPDHYGDDDSPAPVGSFFSAFGRNPGTPADHPDALTAIHNAMNKHGTIPRTFKEAG